MLQLLPHDFEIPRRRRLGVRQLAAAVRSQFFAIQIGNHKGASKLAYSKGFAFDKNCAALGEDARARQDMFKGTCYIRILYGSVFNSFGSPGEDIDPDATARS
jgi:hypothetical protein